MATATRADTRNRRDPTTADDGWCSSPCRLVIVTCFTTGATQGSNTDNAFLTSTRASDVLGASRASSSLRAAASPLSVKWGSAMSDNKIYCGEWPARGIDIAKSERFEFRPV